MFPSRDSLAAAAPTLPLTSLHFLALALVSVLVLRCLLRGAVRRVAILALSLYFFQFFAGGWMPWVLLGGLIGTTYVAMRLRAGPLGARLPGGVWLVLIVLLWTFLFLIKAPQLLAPVNPFFHHPVALIGVSYMVFRCIALVMDADPEESPSLVSCINYVLFFPTLLAGPIESYDRFRQFEDGADLHLDESPLPALHRLVNGFIKKFVIADNLALLGLTANVPEGGWSRAALWVGILVMRVVLYLECSGYCDMLIGLVRLMAFRLAENFDRPWLARNIQEFWSRWHITLSEFIRNYLFNQLWSVAVRQARPSWHFPIALGLYFFTMVLLGLWHAPTWGFLAFGVLHGLALVVVQLLHRHVYPRLPERAQTFVRTSWLSFTTAGLATYLVVALSMVLWTQGVTGTVTVLRTLVGA